MVIDVFLMQYREESFFVQQQMVRFLCESNLRIPTLVHYIHKTIPRNCNDARLCQLYTNITNRYRVRFIFDLQRDESGFEC